MSAAPETTTRSRPPAPALAVAVLALLGVVGAALMSIAHLGIEVPGIGGPGRLLLPVAIGFAVGTVLFAIVAYATLRQRPWAWPVALVVNGLAFVSAAFPIRDVASVVAAGICLVAVIILVSRPGRAALLYRD